MTFDSNDITTEACAWVAQIDTGDMSAADIAAFREWVSRSPRHAAEMREIAELSGQLSVLVEMLGSLDSTIKERRKLERRSLWGQLVARPVMVMTLIASLSIIIVGSWYSFGPISPDEPLVYATRVGASDVIDLADGTRVELNTDSELEVHYTETLRKVRVIRGEAFFNVAHNKERPFVVYAGNRQVRAVGTAFSVKHDKQDFEVIVTEGVVAVEPVKVPIPLTKQKVQDNESEVVSNDAEPVLMTANQVIQMHTSQKVIVASAIVSRTPRDMQRQLSWREGLFDFSETPLAEVVAEMNRYTTRTIEIADPDIASVEFGGIFRTNEVDALIGAFESLGIRVEYIGKDTVRLYRGVG